MEDLLDKHFELLAEIHRQFGFVQKGRLLQMHDSRAFCWYLNGEGPGAVYFAETRKDLLDGIDDPTNPSRACEVEAIHTQMQLPKWVYRTADYTMICCDSLVDRCKLLRIFDNVREYRPVALPPQAKPVRAKRKAAEPEPQAEDSEE